MRHLLPSFLLTANSISPLHALAHKNVTLRCTWKYFCQKTYNENITTDGVAERGGQVLRRAQRAAADNEVGAVQLAHGLEAPGFNPCDYKVRARLQAFAFTNPSTCAATTRQRSKKARPEVDDDTDEEFSGDLLGRVGTFQVILVHVILLVTWTMLAVDTPVDGSRYGARNQSDARECQPKHQLMAAGMVHVTNPTPRSECNPTPGVLRRVRRARQLVGFFARRAAHAPHAHRVRRGCTR
jgi:hypothetical protein